jgi:predicted XRE-type DNA-binding protein
MAKALENQRDNDGLEADDIVRGCGNIFADLGFPDADERLAKADLASKIASIIEDRGLTQVEAARITGLTQPKVSLLTRGLLDDFSSDRLFRVLNRLGVSVSLVLSNEPDWKAGATIVRDASREQGDVEEAPCLGMAL